MSGTNGAAGAPQVGPALPPLYQGLEPLTVERHGGLRLRDVGFTFAADAPAIPLTAEEFTAAFGVPAGQLGKPISEIKDAYGFTPEDVRAWLEARLQQ